MQIFYKLKNFQQELRSQKFTYIKHEQYYVYNSYINFFITRYFFFFYTLCTEMFRFEFRKSKNLT